jgi:hypothetical protein
MATQCWCSVPLKTGARNLQSILLNCSGPLVSLSEILLTLSLLMSTEHYLGPFHISETIFKKCNLIFFCFLLSFQIDYFLRSFLNKILCASFSSLI